MRTIRDFSTLPQQLLNICPEQIMSQLKEIEIFPIVQKAVQGHIRKELLSENYVPKEHFEEVVTLFSTQSIMGLFMTLTILSHRGLPEEICYRLSTIVSKMILETEFDHSWKIEVGLRPGTTGIGIMIDEENKCVVLQDARDILGSQGDTDITHTASRTLH